MTLEIRDIVEGLLETAELIDFLKTGCLLYRSYDNAYHFLLLL